MVQSLVAGKTWWLVTLVHSQTAESRGAGAHFLLFIRLSLGPPPRTVLPTFRVAPPTSVHPVVCLIGVSRSCDLDSHLKFTLTGQDVLLVLGSSSREQMSPGQT